MIESRRFSYQLFGLRLSCELFLPELPPSTATGPADVEIAFGTPPIVADEKPGYTVAGAGTLLSVPGVGRYWIERDRILVEPATDASEKNLRLFLLGSAFGALIHQRGLLPLHANAIEIGDRAVAFMGRSGAGKSTIAAWFHDRGFRVLADDVCVVAMDGAGRPFVHSGVPRLRLWREALKASGRTTDTHEPSFDGRDKFDVPTAGVAPVGPIELSHVYLLGQARSGAGGVRSLKGVEAVNALVANTYRGSFIPRIGGTRRHLLNCLALIDLLPVFAAERRWGFDAFDDEAHALELHARKVIGESPYRSAGATSPSARRSVSNASTSLRHVSGSTSYSSIKTEQISSGEVGTASIDQMRDATALSP